jgi:hypothetical protein
MRARVSRVLRMLAAAALLGGSVSAAAAPVEYAVDAALDPAARTIAGSVEMRLENPAAAPIEDVALVLYPSRFAPEEPGIDDLNRPYVYPREEHVPGGMWVEEVAVRSDDDPAWRRVPSTRLEAIGAWSETLLRTQLPEPLAPGERIVLRARFRTLLPERYGPFGVAEGRIAALGGWFPFAAALGADGRWDPATPPAPAAVAGRLVVPASHAVAVGATIAAPGHGGEIAFALPPGHPPTLLASEDYRLARGEVAGVPVVFLELPSRRAAAFPRLRPRAAVVMDATERVLRAAPPGVCGPAAGAGPAEPLVVAEAPLRLEPAAPGGARVAVVSDRILRVHRLVREFHERELAAAIYAACLRAGVAGRETPADAPWVLEGVAAELADRYLRTAYPRHRTVYDWIALFDVFAIVDRFESAPKIPMARAFFLEARRADELGDGVETFARERPPGRTIFTKLRNAAGEAAVAAAIDGYLGAGAGREGGVGAAPAAGRAPGGDPEARAEAGAGRERVARRPPPFRAAAAAAHGAPLDWLFAQWVAPYPAPLDYALERADLNRPDGTHRLEVTRRSSRPIREAVELEVRGRRGARARLVWDDDRDRAVFTLADPPHARRALLDPDRRLLEDTRAGNARPPLNQVVLDSADVTVTSSELSIAGLFVGRRRYDYTRDLGLVAFLNDRMVGMHVGPRLHFGPPNDATSYRHNLYGYYTVAGLRGDFRDDSRPARRTDGTLGGVGVRYDYTDEIAFDNPARAHKLRLFADWYTGALGSSFDYATAGVRASAVRPLGTARTLAAAQVLNAFSFPIGGDRVPNQGRYSLGGDLAIRGIPVEARLGENAVLVRAELRQMVYPEVDLNLADFLVLRRGQLRFFVDAGRVEDRRSSLYRLADFGVGVGVGAAAFYDFMGFHPAVAYVAIAQRVDRFRGVDNDVQFLFGTRQSF